MASWVVGTSAEASGRIAARLLGGAAKGHPGAVLVDYLLCDDRHAAEGRIQGQLLAVEQRCIGPQGGPHHADGVEHSLRADDADDRFVQTGKGSPGGILVLSLDKLLVGLRRDGKAGGHATAGPGKLGQLGRLTADQALVTICGMGQGDYPSDAGIHLRTSWKRVTCK
jgi:hypothetical protein